jgi:hypothetical protein
MSYDELVEYFGNRSKEAVNRLNQSIEKAPGSIKKQNIVSAIDNQIDNLDPSKGNLGYENVVAQLDGLKNN